MTDGVFLASAVWLHDLGHKHKAFPGPGDCMALMSALRVRLAEACERKNHDRGTEQVSGPPWVCLQQPPGTELAGRGPG